MRKVNNGVFGKYIAMEIALILVLCLATKKEPDNEIINLLFPYFLCILYHIVIFFSFYYGVKIIYSLRKYNKKQIILFIGIFAVNFILLLITVACWLDVIFELS